MFVPESRSGPAVAVSQDLGAGADARAGIEHGFRRQACSLEIDGIDLCDTGIEPIAVGEKPGCPRLGLWHVLRLIGQAVDRAIGGDNLVSNGVRSIRAFNAKQWAQCLNGNVGRAALNQRGHVRGHVHGQHGRQ